MNYVLSIIGALIALVEVGFIIYKHSNETLRRRRNETIIIYGSIFIKTYHLRDKLIELTGNPTFSSKAISENNELYKATMDYLTIVEGFAKGLDYGVYDFQTFVVLTPREMFEILSSLNQFVYDERRKKSYDLLFDGFICLTNTMSICIQKKD